MKRMLLASAALLVAFPALAQQVGGDVSIPAGLTNGNFQNGVNSAISTGQIGSTSTAAGGAGGVGGAGGTSQSGSRSAANGSVSSANTFTSPSTLRNTPSSTLALGTAYCQNSAGITGSGPGFSFGASFGKHDADCIRFNQAMALAALGEQEAAILVLANSREVNAAVSEARRRAAARQVAAPVQSVAMNPASPRDPRPSPQQCGALRRLADPSQVQRDYLVNCGS